MPLNHHVSDRDLVLALDDELEDRRRARVAAHLEQCASCRARLQRAEQALAEAAQTYREQTRTSASLRARLQMRMIEESAQPRGLESARWSTPGLMGAALAGVGVALLATALAMRTPPSGGVSPERAMVEEVEPGALPVPRLTPGATRPVTLAELCDGRDHPAESIAESVRQAVLRDYQMANVPSHEYELDYLITPELGGSADRQNLWPERYSSRTWNARVKDQLEEMLPRLVCDGAVELRAAQRDIATDWIAAYKKYFRTERPLAAKQMSRLILPYPDQRP